MSGRFPTKVGYEFTPINAIGARILSKNGSGIYPGIYHPENAVGRSYDVMMPPLNMVSLPKVLREEGYKTLHLGKWHLGTTNESRSFNQGFDETLDFSLISLFLPADDPRVVNCKFHGDPFDGFLWSNSRHAIRKNNGEYFAPRGYMTDYLAEEASRAISANKENPFFMYLAFSAPHTPLQALKTDYDTLSHISDHCSRTYAAMLLSLDRAVGTILHSLEVNGLTDNTMVIFTSDNGAPNYIAQPDLNKPFRGWKATFFEGGIRVPLLIKWPKKIPKGTVYSGVVSHVDIFATSVTASGVQGVSSRWESDGVDLLSLLPTTTHQRDTKNIKEEQDILSSSNHVCSSMMNQKDYFEAHAQRLLFWRSGGYSAIRYGDWKLQVSSNPFKYWLYNLCEDPTEQMNLASAPAHEEIVQRLKEILLEENAKQVQPVWQSVSETPVSIDHTTSHPLAQMDEYVYWAN